MPNTHGGIREGAGRRALPDKVTLVATVQAKHLAYLTTCAEAEDTSISAVLRAMIDRAAAKKRET